jgi:hypothetical protein
MNFRYVRDSSNHFYLFEYLNVHLIALIVCVLMFLSIYFNYRMRSNASLSIY